MSYKIISSFLLSRDYALGATRTGPAGQNASWIYDWQLGPVELPNWQSEPPEGKA